MSEARLQMLEPARPPAPIPVRRVVRTWWPLAASWGLMALEGPAISAIVARLADPTINLAAYGGLILPLASLVEVPIIMLLAASTALSKDFSSYRKIRTFMHGMSASLTLVHVVIAFTPLYDLFAKTLIHAPAETIEPGRIGLMIMVPWTWAIAYRRFNQGVLIRFGHSFAVGLGTLIRLVADGAVLAVGYCLGSVAGIVVASAATVAGVVGEAVYVGIRVRPVLRDQLKPAPPVAERLTLRAFLRFYVPLSLTSLIFFVARPIAIASIARMPAALDSLAAWPVVTGVIFLVRSFGVAYNEVVVTLLDESGSSRVLRRFTFLLAGLTTGGLLLFAGTPFSGFWFAKVTGLSQPLAQLAQMSVWFALPLPALSVLQSWNQGIILHSRRTRSITEAVILFLAVDVALLSVGVAWGKAAGLYVGLAALSTGELLRNSWLGWRSRRARRALAERDALPAS